MLGNIIGRPVKPLREIGELDCRGNRAIARGEHRQGRARRQIGGNLIIEHPLGEPRTAQGLKALARLDDHAAIGARLNDRVGFGDAPGLAVGPAEMNPALEIGIDEPGGRDQPRVAVFLAHALRQPRNNRAFGEQSFGNAFKTDLRLASG